MTKQTINLLGGLLVVVIVLAGIFLGVVPRLNQAAQSHQDRDAVAMQNQTQQTLISAYAQQRQQLPGLQAQVASLKRQIAAGPHLEQLIDVASGLPDGAALVSITPAGSSGSGAVAASPSASVTATPGATPSGAASGTVASGFEALPVTVVVSLRKPADAAAVLDRLRAGPRLFLIDHVTLAGSAASGSKSGAGATLTVAGSVFMNAGAS